MQAKGIETKVTPASPPSQAAEDVPDTDEGYKPVDAGPPCGEGGRARGLRSEVVKLPFIHSRPIHLAEFPLCGAPRFHDRVLAGR